MTEPMTAERLAEIEARHTESTARNMETGHAPVSQTFIDRAELLAEVKRLQAVNQRLAVESHSYLSQLLKLPE